MASIDNVQDVTPRVRYTALAAQVAFDYPFAIFADADITVDVDGVTKTLTTDYSVSGAGNDGGGTVTFVTAPGAGAVVTIYRDIPISRTEDFQQNGPWSSVSFNDELDKIFLILQELENKVGRAIRFPQTAAITNAQAELNPVSNYLGKFIRVTSAGILEAADALDNTVSLTAEVIGALLNPQTTSEASAGITPSAYRYEAGDIRRYGAASDGVSDARAAVVTADSVGVTIIFTGSLDYVIATDLTVSNPVRIDHGSRLKPSSGATVTLNGGLLCQDNDWSEKRTGDGDLTIGIAQAVKADWWLAPSTTLSSPNDTVQRAITGTARGSTIYFKGQYVSTPIDIIFDEGNQATATNRDAGKSFLGMGRTMPFRFGTQSVSLGAEIILGNSENDDLLTFTGARISSQPSRGNIFWDGIGLNGNKANNSSGRCVYLVSAKDVHFGTLFATSAAGNGIQFSSTGSESSNVCNAQMIVSVNHGGDGLLQGGLGDPQWDIVHVGGNTGDGLNVGAGMMINQLHSYVNGEHGVVITGNVRIGYLRVNTCDDANVLIAATSKGGRVDHIHSLDSALDPSGDTVDAHVVFSGTSLGFKIGSLHCDDTGTAAKRWVYLTNGAARNEIASLTGEGTPSGAKVFIASGAENDGNFIGVGYGAQHVAYAASITPDPFSGQTIFFGELTGALSLGNFTSQMLLDGYELVTHFDADGTNRAVTWNARFNHPDGASTTINANTERLMRWVAKAGVFQLASDQTL